METASPIPASPATGGTRPAGTPTSACCQPDSSSSASLLGCSSSPSSSAPSSRSRNTEPNTPSGPPTSNRSISTALRPQRRSCGHSPGSTPRPESTIRAVATSAMPVEGRCGCPVGTFSMGTASAGSYARTTSVPPATARIRRSARSTASNVSAVSSGAAPDYTWISRSTGAEFATSAPARSDPSSSIISHQLNVNITSTLFTTSLFPGCLYDDVLARAYYLGYLQTCLLQQSCELFHCEQVIVSTIDFPTGLNPAFLSGLLSLLLAEGYFSCRQAIFQQCLRTAVDIFLVLIAKDR